MQYRAVIITLICFVFGGCASSHRSWTATYNATLDGVTGTARISAAGDRVLMKSHGQRKTSVSILRYDRGIAWLLAPTLGIYREIPLSALHKEFPLFFDPTIQIARTELGKELLDGRETMKYAVEITQNGAIFKGFLWEAVPPLPVPLRWEDERGRVATWEDVVVGPLSPALFEIPDGYKAADTPEMAQADTAPPEKAPISGTAAVPPPAPGPEGPPSAGVPPHTP